MNAQSAASLRPAILARGYALLQLLAACALLYNVYTSGRATYDLAVLSGGLPADQVSSIAQRSVLVLGVALQSIIAVLLFAAGITLLFLASGMWRYREWARHATLVLAIISVPVLAVSLLINRVLLIAAGPGLNLPTLIPVGAVAAGIVLCLFTVYLFAYRAEVIALYLPRPNLVRGTGNKFVYGATPIPVRSEKKK